MVKTYIAEDAIECDGMSGELVTIEDYVRLRELCDELAAWLRDNHSSCDHWDSHDERMLAKYEQFIKDQG